MEDAKNFFNIVFFIVMCTLGILSYIQARKTLFSPIKTEIFKVQIDEFKSVLAFFNKRSQTDFDEEFDFQKILEINALQMQLSYINLFFKNQISAPKELTEFLKSSTYGVVVSKEKASKFFEVVTPGSELKENNEEDGNDIEEPPAALILAQWENFMLPGTHYTEKFHEKMNEITLLAASPLLPKNLTNLMYDFIKVINENLMTIGKQVELAAKEMPHKYATPKDVIRFNPSWIWNNFNHERKSTDEASAKILSYINEHLKIDEIIK